MCSGTEARGSVVLLKVKVEVSLTTGHIFRHGAACKQQLCSITGSKHVKSTLSW